MVWSRRDRRCNALILQRFNVISVSDLPAINATLNFVNTIFISAGWYFIRRNFWQRHVVCMVTAVVSSALFLVGYITYHIHVGEKSSGFRGWLAAIYLSNAGDATFCSPSSPFRWSFSP